MHLARVSLITFVLLLLSSRGALATQTVWDYGAEFDGRAYPVAGLFNGTGGLTYFLWDRRDPGNDWQYGYIRPNLTASSIGVTNMVNGALDIFPVSFFGISFGWMESSRTTQADGFNCSTVKCDGLLKYAWVQPQLAVGAGAFFGLASVKFSRISSASPAVPFLEDLSSLIGAPGGDVLTSWSLTAGMKVFRQHSIAAIYGRERFRSSENANQSFFVVASRDSGPWSVSLGPGIFSSSHTDTGISALAFIQWTGLPGPGLLEK